VFTGSKSTTKASRDKDRFDNLVLVPKLQTKTKKMKKNLLVLLGVFALSISAMAQTPATQMPTLLIADDSSSGIYKRFWAEMQGVLKSDPNFQLQFKEIDPAGGAVGNLEALINNQASIAFMHADVLKFRLMNSQEDLTKFKVFMTLFNEDVHFLTKRANKMTGGWGGYNQTEVKLTDVMSLGSQYAGYQCVVGAAGGGFVTANVIRSIGQVNYKVVKYNSGTDVMAALEKGEIDAAVFVGASPLPNLEKLNGEYRLLPISAGLSDRLRSVYKPTTITYAKMDPSPVTTVSAKCLMVSKEYKGKRMIAQLDEFRKAVYAGLPDIQETPGNHPKWSQVDPSVRSTFPWLSLPSDKPLPKDPDDLN
jgi:TRAP-type uncharacterized transport system substrate-binding protein